MDRADDIWESIRYVNDQLEHADPSERQRLLDEKTALQMEARALAAAGISTAELETELTEATRRWLASQGERIDHVKHAGGGDFSGDVRAGADVIYMNNRIDEAQGAWRTGGAHRRAPPHDRGTKRSAAGPFEVAPRSRCGILAPCTEHRRGRGNTCSPLRKRALLHHHNHPAREEHTCLTSSHVTPT